MTIVSRLQSASQAKPNAIFCTFLHCGVTTPITFGELFERSSAYAQAYMDHGVRKGDLILVILQHTPHLFYSYLGAVLAGAVPSFMPFPSAKQRPELYWRDHDTLFKRIEPRLIVTYEENLNAAKLTLSDFSVPTIIANDAVLQTPRVADLSGLRAEPDNVACLQHSSGTTGLKKGVILTHRAILDEVSIYARAIGFTKEDSIASWLPLYHDMGFVGCFMTSVILGTHLVALDPFEWVMRPTQLLDAIQQYGTTFSWLPNFAFSHIANSARRGAQWDLSRVRAFINCSEPCKPATFERFLERFRESGVRREQLQVCYAMAENVFAVTQTRMDQPAEVLRVDADALASGKISPSDDGTRTASLLSCGFPLEGVQIEIRDEKGAPLEDRCIGEVWLRSHFMFDGYYKLPDKTSERIQHGWYRTGDVGFVHKDQLYVTGRIDDMIIVNGRNYYAHEIEGIVNEVPGTIPGRSVAIGIHDARTDGTVVVVLVECRSNVDDDAIALEIRRLVLESVGLAIHSVVVLNSGEMIKTTSGKISRLKNSELYMSGNIVPRGVERVS